MLTDCAAAFDDLPQELRYEIDQEARPLWAPFAPQFSIFDALKALPCECVICVHLEDFSELGLGTGVIIHAIHIL